MSEEAGFIRAVVANPGDYTLRLAYADWLEERSDPRAEYLRLLCAAAQSGDAAGNGDATLARLRELRDTLDPRWVALMHRGIVRRPGAQERGRRRRRSDRQVRAEADLALFLRQYARKAEAGHDPNDRGYDREMEKRVKRMRPEDLDRLIRGDDDPEPPAEPDRQGM
jgi:uncharacterized protein (TIGR02996 family)